MGCKPEESAIILGQPIANNNATICTNERTSQLIDTEAIPACVSTDTPKTGEMSSGSTTQSNDDRSYEQYSKASSQPHLQPSSQGSSDQEYRTLQEDETGFIKFRRTQFDLPESISREADLNPAIASDPTRRSQSISQVPETDGPYEACPETPAVVQRLLQHGGNEVQLMAASQLFGQTQWTSAVKKFSPTSSRPSPDVFNHIATSPNPAMSSPLKNRGLRTSPTNVFTSSPVHVRTSSKPLDDKTPSLPTNSREEEGLHQKSIAETPISRPNVPKRRAVLEPIGEYKPLRKQSLEIVTAKSIEHSDEEQDSDFEMDAIARRRMLARLRQEKASKSFPSVSLFRSDSNRDGDVEVPSTSRPQSAQNRRIEKHKTTRYYGKSASDDGASQETIADSQEGLAPPPPPQQYTKSSSNATNKSNGASTDIEGPRNSSLPLPRALLSDAEYRETIPETSPSGTLIEPPRLLDDIMRQESSIRSEIETVSFPVLSNGTDPEQQPNEPDEPKSSSLPEPLSLIRTDRKEKSGRGRPLDSSPSVVQASPSPSGTRRSTRPQDIVTPTSIEHNPPLLSDPGTRSSTLTSLSATPSMPSSITPNTEPEHVSEDNERHISSSPPAAKPDYDRRLSSTLPKPLPPFPKMKRQSPRRDSTRRSTYHDSLSTDELAGSPISVSSMPERRAPTRKPSRKSLANQSSRRVSTAKQGIFEGMVFAISFQNAQGRKSNEKHPERVIIEQKIRQNGGRILSDGFDELFKFDSFQATSSTASVPTLSSSLTLLNEDTGFTALIADGHSRKVKYMQALALGIPCLAPRWVTNCVAKQEIVDWTSYLLCAGPSMVLGEAIRSRNLQPYDASMAKLVDVINDRPKLLDETQILLVMKKTKNEGRRLPYVFLAQILGGSLERVQSLDEARVRLRERESQDRPFDWVYVDDHLHNAQNALFGAAAGDAAPKKRKRQSTGSEDSNRPPKRIRTLNDELVIQSLILGRLVEEGEMDG